MIHARRPNDDPDLEGDSQIVFRLKHYIGATAGLAQIEVDIALDGDEPAPRIHLDYGGGFAPEASLAMSRAGGTWQAFVPLPHLLARAKLDLRAGPGAIVLGALVARRASALEFADLVLRRGSDVAELVAGRRAREAVRCLAKAVPNLGKGGEVADQAAMATVLACALSADVPD